MAQQAFTTEEHEAERPPLYRVGDPVFIRDETDTVLSRYPYTIGSRFRYGGDTIWSWAYGLKGIRGDNVTTVFESQLARREA